MAALIARLSRIQMLVEATAHTLAAIIIILTLLDNDQ